jgi:Helix-turn-helix family
MWTLFEPIHDVTYFSSAARTAFEDAGLRGFWRGYFAGRAAPLGPVPAAPVVAAFFSFAPHMVARALPDVWTRATPERALAARLDGAVDALRPLAGDTLRDDKLAEAVELIESAVEGLEPAGRVLGAANLALCRPGPRHPGQSRPDELLARLWQAATTLREHRGDGHIAALVTAGLTGCQAIVLRSGMDLGRELMQTARGWSDEDWSAATAQLAARGWLDEAGRATAAGIDGYQQIEATTDTLAAVPWDRIGRDATARLAELLYPLSVACHRALPAATPIGVPVPSVRG